MSAIANEQAAGIPKEVSTKQEPTGHANAAGGIKIKVQRIKEEAGAVSCKPGMCGIKPTFLQDRGLYPTQLVLY